MSRSFGGVAAVSRAHRQHDVRVVCSGSSTGSPSRPGFSGEPLHKLLLGIFRLRHAAVANHGLGELDCGCVDVSRGWRRSGRGSGRWRPACTSLPARGPLTQGHNFPLIVRLYMASLPCCRNRVSSPRSAAGRSSRRAHVRLLLAQTAPTYPFPAKFSLSKRNTATNPVVIGLLALFQSVTRRSVTL